MTEHPRKLELTSPFIKAPIAATRRALFWDTLQPGLALQVQPTGHKSFKVVYRHSGRPRWYCIGSAERVGLKDARQAAREVLARVTLGADPQGEKTARRQATRSGERFREVAARYVEQEAKKKQKAWKQGVDTRRRHVMPKIGDKRIVEITRADVEAIFDELTASGRLVLANQVKAHTSAVLAWAHGKHLIPFNPAAGIDDNKTESRSRVLEPNEVAEFWDALGCLRRGTDACALKVLHLLGQRPSEVRFMRQADLSIGEHEFEQHRADGRMVRTKARGAWWTLPGGKEEGWPGTKNGRTHEVWIPARALELFEDLLDGKSAHVFRGRGGMPVRALSEGMREACEMLKWTGAKRATPHDLRRSHGTMITGMGFGRDVMNRIQNHAEGGIGDVYDRHRYRDEKRRVQEAVAARIVALSERRSADNVAELLRLA